MEPRLYVN